MRIVCFLILSLSSLGVGISETPLPAPLVLEGQELFTFRTRIGSIQPADRVNLISTRLKRLSDDRLFDLNKIGIQEDELFGWQILAGDSLLMVITPEDAKLEKRPAKVIAELITFRLKEILEADRRSKSPKEVLIHAVYALIATIGLILILFGLAITTRSLRKRLENWQGTLIRSVQIKTFEILSAARITKMLLWLVGALRLVLTLTLLYFYVPLVLSLFPWTAKLSPILLGYVTTPLRQIAHGVVLFIPNLFFIAITLLITRYVLKFIRAFFLEIETGTLQLSGFYQEWAAPTYQLVRLLAIAFTLVVIFPYLPGSSSPAFQGVSVFLGVIVSFGSTSAIANIIAGLVLTYMRSFRIGDRVKVGDTMGDVIDKNLLSTRVRTVKNVDITIPNSLVLNSHILNFSSSAMSLGLILHTEVTIGYDAPWRTVHDLLIKAALQSEGILASPPPFVLQTSLDDSYVRYEINAFTQKSNSMASIYSALRQNIQDSFNNAGVEIMSPSYAAIRDGNTTTIPADQRPANYEAPVFRTHPVPK